MQKNKVNKHLSITAFLPLIIEIDFFVFLFPLAGPAVTGNSLLITPSPVTVSVPSRCSLVIYFLFKQNFNVRRQEAKTSRHYEVKWIFTSQCYGCGQPREGCDEKLFGLMSDGWAESIWIHLKHEESHWTFGKVDLTPGSEVFNISTCVMSTLQKCDLRDRTTLQSWSDRFRRG